MTPNGSAYTEESKNSADEWSRKIIGAAIEVHRHLGPGLLEDAYEECLCRELELRNIPFQRQFPVNIDYKGIIIQSAYRLDVLVADLVIIECKSVRSWHQSTMRNYLPTSVSISVGLAS